MAKILVIDDDPVIVDLLRLRLTQSGHQVAAAHDAYGAAAAAAQFKPDLVTLDFDLPAGNGVKILERLRGSAFTAATPVVFITAMSPYDLAPLLPPDPKIRCLQKPIDMPELGMLMAELLGLAAPAIPPEVAATPHPLDGGALGGDILDGKP
ncbi:MAG TPA: hypothetical protein DCZ01_02480 [Elusimicrobia bacterium]|nr:MAG: hypothetical protein A2X37_09925 [Elusimicrobia bacterium GWA2_66_18]HAZ07395.1 hypothetical protein [Elusimicrobiota bacterium]